MPDVAETSALNLQLDGLRASGAEQTDPVRFRFLEALAQRLSAKGLQNTRHWQNLEQAVADYQARCELADQPPICAEPRAPSPLSALLDQLNQSQATPTTPPRSELEQLIFGLPEAHSGATSSATPQPLKAMARVKADHSVQVLQERLHHAIEHAPENAGPMNAHRLVSRAIAEMQKLSPEYLHRFANYTDTLMALEKLGRKS
ncbi:DUF2894 domain-containing protein [Marinobacter sp.]|uniref:DUF2894 domain-containing protein n=1 Tax=Marinobacter sp. TaxID=50741 RepID=UPI0035650F08